MPRCTMPVSGRTGREYASLPGGKGVTTVLSAGPVSGLLNARMPSGSRERGARKSSRGMGLFSSSHEAAGLAGRSRSTFTVTSLRQASAARSVPSRSTKAYCRSEMLGGLGTPLRRGAFPCGRKAEAEIITTGSGVRTIPAQ
ncbi:MAG: hypothetical protein HY812_14025 [Planctomycetes bacterium]|nr:hypothetical protein [Planctomycetota bacterium]